MPHFLKKQIFTNKISKTYVKIIQINLNLYYLNLK